jgi:hypothetical protein
MKRIALLTTLAALALPATALAQGECPSTMKPGGTAVGGLDSLGVTLRVEVFDGPATNPIETTHGAVHWERTGSLIYVAPESGGVAKRAWNTFRETFEGPFSGPYVAFVTAYYRVWGPGTRVDPYYVDDNGEMGHCVVAAYTPYREGVWPTRFGEARPIR